MITYALLGAAPKEVAPRLLQKIGNAFRGVRGIPAKAEAGLRFVSRQQIQKLNQDFRSKNRPTDVLSFSAREGTGAPRVRMPGPVELGDIVVCPAVAREEARRRNMDAQEEMVRLIVHGTLHLAGMDHATEADEQKMFRVQERLIEQVLS